jgi:hydrophobic/amphiphilic exporter-1 (mainly G- bacteria), HAE1 family
MSIIRTAISRPVTVSMCVVAVTLFGLVSLDRLALNLLPNISYPSLTIQTDYQDAAPEEVENLITRPMEEAVGVIPGLARITSVSRSGQSEVVLEFAWKTKMELATLEVREKLDFVDLPKEADKPVILRFDPSHDPILRLRLYGDLPLSQLRSAADRDLRKALESTDGVAAIKIIGGLEEQIHVEIDERRLAELDIPITAVTEALQQENLNQAAGSLYDQDANYLVRMLNQFKSVDEIRAIIIRDQGGRKVILGDVAKVFRGAKEREIIARLHGKESVEMAFYKEGDANTVTVANTLQKRLAALKHSEKFPKGVEYEVVFNQAGFIQSAVDNVFTAALLGGLLATIILFLFLRDLRSTLTIGFSIPISVMATFALMYQTDITLNIMSLGGVALGIGMLVDNSIVVLESVHRHRKAAGRLAEAVYRGTKEVGTAVTASTFTTVAVFLPLVFVEGIAGQLFKDQALTITYSLLASLLVALTVIPMILAMSLKSGQVQTSSEPTDSVPVRPVLSHRKAVRFFQRTGSKIRAAAGIVLSFVFTEVGTVIVTDIRRLIRGSGRLALKVLQPGLDLFDRAFGAVTKAYPKLLLSALNNKSMLLGLVFVLAASAALVSLDLGGELIPSLTQGEFSVEIKLPEGKALPETDRIMKTIETEVSGYPEVQTVFSSIGGSNRNQFARNTVEEHLAQLYVVMRDRRDKTAEEAAMNRLRGALSHFPELTYTFSRPTLFTFKTPVEVEVFGYELKELRAASDLVAARLATVAGLRDITTTTQLGNPEIHVVFDRDRLARLGLEERQVSNVVRNKIRGDVATRYREEDRQIDILVRVEEADRNTMQSIENLVISGNARGTGRSSENTQENPQVVPIRLGSVASVALDRGPAEIRRIRGQRAAVVSANLTGRDLSTVAQEIQSHLQELRPLLPINTTVGLAGQNEELATSYRSLLFALALAVFLVYLVMASQFESLVHPFIILFTVPLALIGVIFSLWITGTTVNVMVFLGVIILAGIVVNNAIILIDYTNQLRKQGYARREALLKAGEVRLRPIFMTTLTTVLGLLPMAISWGEGAEIRAPMAIAVMGGLLFSTLLTLVLIPVVYELVDRKVYEPRLESTGATELATGAGNWAEPAAESQA